MWNLADNTNKSLIEYKIYIKKKKILQKWNHIFLEIKNETKA